MLVVLRRARVRPDGGQLEGLLAQFRNSHETGAMKPVSHIPRVAAWAASMLAMFSTLASAQQQAWLAQFGTAESDVLTVAAPDGSGGVYVGGETQGSFGGPALGNGDAWLARYDSIGNRAWIVQSGGSELERVISIAFDGAGAVFVVGSTYSSLVVPNAGFSDAWFARYDSAGSSSWVRQLGTTEIDSGNASAPDGMGGVFIGGTTSGNLAGTSLGLTDAWLTHYDASGNQAWIRQFGTVRADYVHGAATDDQGGVYVCGTTSGGLGGPYMGVLDAWLAHFDGAGNRTWSRQLGTNQAEYALAATSDGSGGVYLCGRTGGSLAGPYQGNEDAWLARFDSAGTMNWIQQFGTSAADNPNGVAFDGFGSVYLCGSTSGSLGGPNAGVYDAWMARYTGTGDLAWIHQIGTSRIDVGVQAASDGSGGAYFGGSTEGTLGGVSVGSRDVWLARFDDSLVASSYCTPAVANSTGQAGILTATGSNLLLFNDVTLVAEHLPQSSFGYFLTSRTRDLIVGAGGSQGVLCVGGAIGRFVGPGQILNAGATGSFALQIDLMSIPQPNGAVVAQPGETWNFQTWHRDAIGGVATSNFTDALRVSFY